MSCGCAEKQLQDGLSSSFTQSFTDDPDFKKACIGIGQDIEWNKSIFKFVFSGDIYGEVQAVLDAYIDAMVENTNIPIFSDDYTANQDNNSKIIQLVKSKSGKAEDFISSVLKDLYWGTKQNRFPGGKILDPRIKNQAAADYHDKGIVGAVLGAGENIIDGAGNAIKGIGKILNYLPEILLGGVVVVGAYYGWKYYKEFKPEKKGLSGNLEDGIRKHYEVWDDKEKIVFEGGETASKAYYKKHGGEKAGLHLHYKLIEKKPKRLAKWQIEGQKQVDEAKKNADFLIQYPGYKDFAQIKIQNSKIWNDLKNKKYEVINPPQNIVEISKETEKDLKEKYDYRTVNGLAS
jgi:hypothetical protein